MKIAILADPLDNQNAGIHRYTKQLIQSLNSLNSKHEILLIRLKKNEEFPNLKTIVVPSTNLPIGYQSFRLFFIVPLILIKEKVDIVFEPAHFGPFNLPKRILRATMIHDLTPIILSDYHRFHSQILQKIFLKRILRKTNLVFVNSSNTENDVLKVYPFTKGKTKMILLGKDNKLHAVSNTKVIGKYGLNNQDYFLFVGTIEPRKNLVTLLKAFALFKKQISKPIKLAIVGQNGWKSKAFFEELNKHPNKNDIVLTGFVSNEDLMSLYTHAISFIYPSIYEGFGLPVLEAMSCGAPVITSNNSSLPEVGGNAALYFETKSEKDLNDKMLKVYQNNNLRNEIITKAHTQIQKFSWEKYAHEFLKTIEEK
jgi:glycosyltransferase involved in cell wall biosynthesis